MLLDELAHRAAARMHPVLDAIQRRASGGEWQISTCGFDAANFSKRSAISSSQYSPGVLKGVTVEYPNPAKRTLADSLRHPDRESPT